MKALSLHVTGIVQGVGFRPFVHNLALSLGLAGTVRNASDGVWCTVEGDPAAVDAFARSLREDAPPMAVIDDVAAEEVGLRGLSGFTIEPSEAVAGEMTLVSPDIATCPACASELADPADRRYRYPFINCTNCGPRFTIIDDVPYDRPSTSMAEFPMCPECAAEYADPADRRFHAQPDACFACGPRLYLDAAAGESGALDADWAWSAEREPVPRPHRDRARERSRADAIVETAARLLREGRVLAVKGLGGYQLACDATDEGAVTRLRERKRRWGKPLAVMVRDLDEARAHCLVDDDEAALLAGPVRPIVLLRRRPGAARLAEGIAPRLTEIGLMLPYTPLHRLLIDAADVPLVMTSGNLSDEPIATGNAEALRRLAPVADAVLSHDRGIRSRYDDSVVRVVDGRFEPVRRARGYAPSPLRLPDAPGRDVLAVGPEQKNTFTLVRGALAFVSQHIGDLEDADTLASFESTLALYERLFRVEPRLVAHDLHPEYLSTKFALRLGLPTLGVQHHHAHVAAVLAEHGVHGRRAGVALDGTGYGADGRIWGGEVLLADLDGFERFAHLREVPMPGGAAAVRRPARMAVGALHALGLLGHPGAAPLLGRLADGELDTLVRMAERGVNSPLTSSMGRLFDTIAALAGVRDDALYEGQAAVELEAAADPAADGAYAFGFADGGPIVIDPAPVLEAVLDDVARGAGPAAVSARFHRAVIDAVVRVSAMAAEAAGAAEVALAGGVFMNRLVLAGCLDGLTASGLRPLTPLRLPANDAAVSFGQAAVARARQREI